MTDEGHNKGITQDKLKAFGSLNINAKYNKLFKILEMKIRGNNGMK